MFLKNRLILGCTLVASVSCFMLFWDAVITWIQTLNTPSYTHFLQSHFWFSTCYWEICYPACVTLQGTVYKHVNATWIQSLKKETEKRFKEFTVIFFYEIMIHILQMITTVILHGVLKLNYYLSYLHLFGYGEPWTQTWSI